MGASGTLVPLVTAEQEEQKKRNKEHMQSRLLPVTPATPTVQVQSAAPLAPVSAGGRGITSGIRGTNPGNGGPGEYITAPVPSGAGTVRTVDAKDFRPGNADPSKAAAERAQRDAEEAKRKLDQSRATAESNEDKQARRERQDELSRGARNSRRRNSILTSPLGTIGDLAPAISKTLLGQ